MYFRRMLLGFLISWTSLASSSQGFYVGKVNAVLVDSVNFGGCMALIVPGPEATLINCGAAWVTFSCTGDFNTKTFGNSKLQMVQLAKVADMNVSLLIDDTKMHNGYCFAQRIDIF